MEARTNYIRVKLAILNILTNILRKILSLYVSASNLSDILKERDALKDKLKENQDNSTSEGNIKGLYEDLDITLVETLCPLFSKYIPKCYLRQTLIDMDNKLKDNPDLKRAEKEKSYENLDLTLLGTIFSFFRKYARKQGYGPSIEKDSIFVEVVDMIRTVRNKYAHLPTNELSQEDFSNTWKDLEIICFKIDQEIQGDFSKTLQKYRQCVVNVDLDTKSKSNSLQVKLRHPDTFSRGMERKSETVNKWVEDIDRFFPTRAYKEVERRLSLSKFVTISGNAGSGKSSIAQNVAHSYTFEKWMIIPVDDFEEIITRMKKESQERQLFILEDPLGKDCVDEFSLSRWRCHESTLIHILNSCDIKVLITCRKNILNDKRVPELLLRDKVVIDDSNWKLTTFEKDKILHFRCDNIVEVSENEKKEILKCNEYFPLLCTLFASNEIYQSRGSEFFKFPFLCFREEIRSLKEKDKHKYCALVTLLQKGEIMSYESLTKDRQALENIFTLCGLPKDSSCKYILDALENLNGSLIDKTRGGKFTFRNDIVLIATISILGEDDPKEVVKFCPLGALRKWVKLVDRPCSPISSIPYCYLIITEDLIRELCKRYFVEIRRNYVEVCHCPIFKNENVQTSIIRRIAEMPDRELEECFLQTSRKGVSIFSPFMKFEQTSNELIKTLIPDMQNYVRGKIYEPYPSPILTQFHSLEFLLNNENFLSLVETRMKNAVSLVQELRKVRDTFFDFLYELNDLKVLKANEIYHTDHINILKGKTGGGRHNEEQKKQNESCSEILQACNSDDHETKALNLAFSKYLENVRNEIPPHQQESLNMFLSKYALHIVDIINIVMENIGSSELHSTLTSWSDASERLQILELCFPLTRTYNRKIAWRNKLSELLLTSSAPNLPYLSLPSLEQKKQHDDLKDIFSRKSEQIKTELAIFAYQMSPLTCLLMFGEIKTFNGIIERVLRVGDNRKSLREHNLFFAACVNGCLQTAQRIVEILGKEAMTEKFFCLSFDFCSLHIASLLNHEQIIDYLLQDERFGVNVVDFCGNTPLHLVLYNIFPNLAEQQYKKVINTINKLCASNADKNRENNMGFSHLHVACKNDYTEVVNLFCNESNVNSRTFYGDTPLLLAAEKGNSKVVDFLLQHGAISNEKNDKGYTPLHFAAKRGCLKSIEMLINNNADLNIQSIQGETPLIVAASNGHLDVVKHVIEITSRVNEKDKKGVTVLAGAVSSGRLDLVNLLLQHKANVNLTDNDGNGPLAIAVVEGYVDISELLIRNDANIEQCNNNGESPLIQASIHGQSECVQLLLNKGAKINRKDHKKQSSLWHACQYGHTCITSILLQQNADEKSCDLHRCSPLFIAAIHEHIGSLEVLLQTVCPVNQRDDNGKTVLMTACEHGRVEVVKLLLNYVANTNLYDNNGRSAIWYASRGGFNKVVDILLKDVVEFDKRDSELKTPLYVATEGGYIDTVSLLVGNNASMELCDKKGRSPLSIAAAIGHMSILKFLIFNGADINTKDKISATPLFYAVGNDKKDALLMLIDFGAKVDITDKEGNTPLHFAAGRGYNNMIRILMDRGKTSSINRQNENGETAFFLACKHNFIDTASLLISRNADINIHNKDGLTPFGVARQNRYDDIAALISQRIKLGN